MKFASYHRKQVKSSEEKQEQASLSNVAGRQDFATVDFNLPKRKQVVYGSKRKGAEEEMSIKTRSATLIAAAAMLAVFVPAGAANAEGIDPAVQAALQRISDGTWTNADAELIGSIPELAARTADPRVAPEISQTTLEYRVDSQGNAVSPANGEPIPVEMLNEFLPSATADTSTADVVTTPAEGGSGSLISPMITGGTWKNTHVTHTHRSYTGGVIYKYHHYARFNYGGGKVRAWGERYDDVTNISDGVYMRSRKVNQKTAVPATSATSYMKREMEHCLPAYCYTTTYPWVKTTVRGTGGTSFSSGIG